MHAYGSFAHDSDEEDVTFLRPHHRLPGSPPAQRPSLLRRVAAVGGVAVLVATVALAAVLTPQDGLRWSSGGIGGGGNVGGGSSGGISSAAAAASGTIRSPELAAGAAGGGGSPSPPSSGELAFTACNEYTCDDPPNFLYPWLVGVKLMEPFRDTFLSVVNPRAEHQYYWTLTDRFGAVATLTGQQVTHQFTELEEHTVTLQEIRPATAEATAEASDVSRNRAAITGIHTETVMCKYVRREIRSLTDSERDEVLDAMHTLWVVSSEDGRALYGPEYTDITGLIKFHHRGASNYSCDAFHDGLGFPISHFLMTNLFEQTIQLVNPKISLPYWDYTIEDSVIINEYNGLYSRMEQASPMFRPTWFGSADADDHMVKDGRWAWTKVLIVSDEDRASGMLSNVYGQLRSPWSANSHPFLVRGMGNSCGDLIFPAHLWPSCQYHHDLLQLDSYYDFAYSALGKSHGPIHFWIGGVNDCDKTFQTIAGLIGPESAALFRNDADANRKNMWRSGLWACEGTVPLGTPMDTVMQDNCGCEQAGWDLEDDGDVMFILSQLIGSEATEDEDIDTKREIVRALCHGKVNMGEQLQSSSPQDPTFWPVHGTVERLLQLKLLSGTLDTSTWFSKSFFGTGMSGDPEFYRVSVYGDECVGHRPYDVWPYGLVTDEEFSVKLYMFGEKKVNTLTNLEATLALDPNVNALPYVYDNFEWPHCDAQNINMKDILSEQRDGGGNGNDGTDGNGGNGNDGNGNDGTGNDGNGIDSGGNDNTAVDYTAIEGPKVSPKAAATATAAT